MDVKNMVSVFGHDQCVLSRSMCFVMINVFDHDKCVWS